MVQTGDLIAVLSNTATWTDVDYIQKQLNDFSLFDHSQSIQKEWINKEYSLGDLQSTFAIFQKSCTDYNHYISKVVRLVFMCLLSCGCAKSNKVINDSNRKDRDRFIELC